MGYAIKIEGLSKCYRISHLAQSGSLRDALDNLKNKFFNVRLKKPSEHTQSSTPSVEEFWALKNITLEIPKGVKLGVLGHNGAGTLHDRLPVGIGHVSHQNIACLHLVHF